jgi:hypothetical protein
LKPSDYAAFQNLENLRSLVFETFASSRCGIIREAA